MVAKKKTTRKKKDSSWEERDATLGKKTDKEHKKMKDKGGSCSCERSYVWYNHKPRPCRFFGAILFIVFLLVILNQQQIVFHNVSWWMETLLAIGFVWMMS